MKVTKAEMELFAKTIEPNIKQIQGVISRFRLLNEALDFETIQSAICSMAMTLTEFYDPADDGDDRNGGRKAKLDPDAPAGAPANRLAIPKRA
jgi:hypothetical protein